MFLFETSTEKSYLKWYFQKLHIIVKYVQMESIVLIACPTVLDLEFIISIYLGI